MTPPLRVLMVVHTLWSRNLGASRVPLELGEEFRELDLDVEKYSYDDAFPGSARPRDRGALPAVWAYLCSNRSFARRAGAFVKRHASRFDVIDANETNIPFSKESLGFKGLLVARSVGLSPAYETFEREAERRWPEPISLRRAIERTLTWPGRHRHQRDVWRSFHHADLINVSNSDDLTALQSRYGTKVVYFPLGISSMRLAALREARASIADRLAARTVAFVGTWNTRKGSRDWPEIHDRLRRLVPDVKVLLLGTGIPREHVRACFPSDANIEIVPQYENHELPRLLSRATVGAFPGYLEGFGFAVLEKLAAGLPTIAYDAPGPRDILGRLGTPAMVTAGDTDAFARNLGRLLTLAPDLYAARAEDSLRAAATFCWRAIAKRTHETYVDRLDRQRHT